MTAVAVWDHVPRREELLAQRRASGWRPMPSRLARGREVVGFAACVPRAEWMPG